MLLDTGADVSLLPKSHLAALVEMEPAIGEYELEAFDGTRSKSPVTQLELLFLGKSFRGQFLLIEGEYGILGRNVLNSLAILLDGPAQSWDLRR